MRATLMVLLILAAPPAPAQQDMGGITGIVTDRSGAAVPGARVTVRNRDTNETQSTGTDVSGSYTVGPLRIGSYDVAVEMTGFKKAVWPAIISGMNRLTPPNWARSTS